MAPTPLPEDRTIRPRVHRRELERLDRLANLLDSRFRIPGTPIRFGLDGLLGVVPVVGDTLVLLPSAWIVWRG